MSSKFVIDSLILAALTIGTVSGQRSTPAPPSGGGTTTSPGAGTTTPGRTTTTPTTTTPGQQSPFPSDTARPIFLSGKVVTSEGVPPPEQVVIERVCGSRTIQEGYTDSKGRFSFELGSNKAAFMDASNEGFGSMRGTSSNSTMAPGSTGVTERSLWGCELRANLPGFRSDVINLANRRSMDNPDVGTIILHRLANVEGLTISATSLEAPKDAKKAFDKGREAAKKGKLDDAAKQFDKAVDLYPKYAVAWYERGRIYEAQNKIDDAKKAYDEALKADSKLITPYDRLTSLAVQSRDWKDAAEISARMIRLNPVDFPQAFLYNSIANLNLQNLDAAQKSAAELLKMDPKHRIPKGEHVMAVILAQKSDWENAAVHFRTFLEVANPGSDVELAKKQLAEVEKTLAAQKQN